MPKIGICDDNTIFLDRIACLVKKAFSNHKGNYEIETFTNGLALLNQNKLEHFDILFLDIDMPNISGFDVAKSLRDNFSQCIIVFISLHSELVFDSLNFQPFYFVRKENAIPLDKSIPAVVNKLVQHFKQDDTIIIEDENARKHAIYIRNIVYIESDGHHVVYCLLSKNGIEKIRIRGRMIDCESKYAAYDFVRIQKSFLVNLRHVTRVNNSLDEVEVLERIRLPMSKNVKHYVDDRFAEFLRSRV